MKKTNKKIALVLVVLLLVSAISVVVGNAVYADAISTYGQDIVTDITHATAAYEPILEETDITVVSENVTLVTVTLQNSASISNLDLSEKEYNVVIDLNGHLLQATGTIKLASDAQLTIKDSKTKAEEESNAKLQFGNNAKLILEEGATLAFDNVPSIVNLNKVMSYQATESDPVITYGQFGVYVDGELKESELARYAFAELKDEDAEYTFGMEDINLDDGLYVATPDNNILVEVAGTASAYKDAKVATLNEAGTKISINHAGTFTVTQTLMDATYDAWSKASASEKSNYTLTQKVDTIVVKPNKDAIATTVTLIDDVQVGHDDDLDIDYNYVEYTGSAWKVVDTVKVRTDTLTEGKDYTVTYKDNVNVGTASYTITGLNDYAGAELQPEESFRIVADETALGAVVGKIADQKFTGSPIAPAFKATIRINGEWEEFDSTKAADLKNWKVLYKDGINEDTGRDEQAIVATENAEIVLEGIAGYNKGVPLTVGTFKITPKETNNLTVKFYDKTQEDAEVTSVEYGITVDDLAVKVFDGDYELLATDYDIVPSDKTTSHAVGGVFTEGTLAITIKDTDNGSFVFDDFDASITITSNSEAEEVTIKFVEDKVKTTGGKTYLLDGDKVYTDTYLGSAIEVANIASYVVEDPEPVGNVATINDEGNLLIEYTDNEKAGEAKVTIKAASELTSNTLVAYFKVEGPSVVALTAEFDFDENYGGNNNDAYFYTGSAITPKLTVYNEGIELKVGKDYNVNFANNTNVTTANSKATATISLIGGLAGAETTDNVFEFDIIPAELGDATITLDKANYEYTGSQIKPTVTVKLDNSTLRANTDYTVEYGDNKEVGTNVGTVTVTGKGNYTGSISVQFTITQGRTTLEIASIGTKVFGTHYVNPNEVVVTDKKTGKILTFGQDYEVLYDDCDYKFNEYGDIDVDYDQNGYMNGVKYVPSRDVAGTRTISVKTTSVYGYVGEATASYTVRKASVELAFTDDEIVKGTKEVEYTIGGTELDLTDHDIFTVTSSNDGVLNIDKDWIEENLNVVYTSNTTVGSTATVRVSLKSTSNYEGDAVEGSYKIKKGAAIQVDIADIEDQPYNGGNDVIPELNITIKDTRTKLVQGTDYKVTVTNAKKVTTGETGKAKVTVKFINYDILDENEDPIDGNKIENIEFNIVEKNLSDDDVTATIDDQVYTGNELTPVPVVKFGSVTLTADDFDVEYTNNVEVGSGVATVKGTGNYTGTKVVVFKIKAKGAKITASNITLSKYKYIYNGKIRKPAVTVVVDGKTLERNVDYKVAWYDNDRTGIGRVVVKGIGSYEGRVEVKFEIKPQAPTAMALDAKETGFRVRWTAPALGEFDGYQVVYATDAEFTNIVRTKRITGKEKVTFTGVPAGTYYVKVRAYKDAADGTRVKSLYSNVESITVK